MTKVSSTHGMARSILCLAFSLLPLLPLLAQGTTRTVSGTVTDVSGAPLMGASVMEKGKTNGTVTDTSGQYALRIAGNNVVLEVSYLGFISTDVAVGQRSTINVQLKEDTQSLSEVVVIGYGTQLKKDLTGSVGVVSQAKMNDQAVVGIGQDLQGKLAGVQITQNDGTPYGGTTIRIRGNGSFGASSNPLVVIDGMITSDGLNNLNPNDVENITILKDAASAAIYGSRG
ncbi:MAG: TonB-dependent receptor plug domain-containing protein, partial [Mediterranea sp.]|nr:TonB-dependent receptor plug domain-containing protein [Mediterranea sp.]